MANKPLPSPEVLRQLVAYDPLTGLFVWKKRDISFFDNEWRFKQWNSRCAGKPAFSSNHGDGYRCGKLFGHVYLAHRIAWAVHYGEWPEHEVDHKDRDRSNNKIVNLRPATDGQNCQNTSARKGTSHYLGVHFDSNCGKWRASVQVNRRRLNAGVFDTEIDAAKARDALALREHGAFARLNF